MQKKLTILGGGITGLAAAYIAAKEGVDVTILEGEHTIGGLLNTFEIGETRLEFFYHHFFTHDAELHWLCRELGISDLLQFHKATMGVFRNGKIYDFNSPMDLLKYSPMSWVDKFRFGLSSAYLGSVAKWEEMENISALEWLYRYAGKGATDNLWKPLLDVKFGPYADKVPIAWMVGRLSQRMHSRKKGEEQLGYINGSLKVVLDKFNQKLPEMGVKIVTDAKVQDFNIESGILKGVQTSQGYFGEGAFLSTIPTIYLARLLKPKASEYAERLGQIEYFGAVCTILDIKKKLSNIYWLNIADEGYPFGGVIEHTNFIPAENYDGHHIVYLSRYFAMSDPLAKATNQEIIEQMTSPLPKIFPQFSQSDLYNVFVFKSQTAATVCDLNFSKKVPDCKTPIENLFISSMPHIYPDERSCNNSIRIAAESCRVMGIDVSYVPKGSSLSGRIGMHTV